MQLIQATEQDFERVARFYRDAIARTAHMDICALTSTPPAHRLYESLGFCRRGQQRWYTDNVGWADFFLYELVL